MQKRRVSANELFGLRLVPFQIDERIPVSTLQGIVFAKTSKATDSAT